MKSARTKLIPLESLSMASECLRTLAHPHRLRMVQMLLQGEFSVAELAEACGIGSHVASDHLGRMKDRGLLSNQRRGRQVFYRVAEQGLVSIMQCIEKRFG